MRSVPLEGVLDGDTSREFLDAVEQEIALFDDHLVVCALEVRSVRLDHVADLVDLGLRWLCAVCL